MHLNESQQSAIADLYRQMYAPMSAYARSALRDPPLAEEAVQDAFRIACAKIDDVLSSPNPRGWLVQTLKYVIQNMLRSRALLCGLVIASPDASEKLAAAPEEPDLDLLYADLAGREDFKLLKMIALERCTMLEAAGRLGISMEACKKRVQRARARLKEYFEKN